MIDNLELGILLVGTIVLFIVLLAKRDENRKTLQKTEEYKKFEETH